MRGIKDFNFPAFHEVAARLRDAGWDIFNPAENDEQQYGVGALKSATGSEAEIEKSAGFSIRKALKQDLSWIADNADAIFLLPGWQKSKGSIAEKALADALGLEVWEVSGDLTGVRILRFGMAAAKK